MSNNKATLSRKQQFQIEDLCRQGNLNAARAKLLEICRQSPRNLDAWLLLADLSLRLNDLNNAISCLQKALQIDGSHAQARVRLAQCHCLAGKQHIQAGNQQQAANCLIEALRHEPNNIEALATMGSLFYETGNARQAIPYLEKLAALRPLQADCAYLLALAIEKASGLERAISHYMQAYQLEPDNFRYQLSYARILNHNGDYALAEQQLLQLATQQPSDITLITELLLAYVHNDRIAEAVALLRPFMQMPAEQLPYKVAIRFLELCDRMQMCDEAAALTIAMLDATDIEAQKLFGAYFLLGRYFDRRQQYDTAFSYYQTGNRLRDTHAAEHDTRIAEQRRLLAVLDKNTFDTMPVSNQTTTSPIFIVGMPRSGTSLVEQILTSHPDVYGTGEDLPATAFINQYLRGAGNTSAFPQCLIDIRQADIDAMAAAYLDAVAEKTAGKDYLRVTNKVPNNYKYVFLLRRLFPQCRIIHCRRDPFDTCLSIYFQSFAGTHAYSHNLVRLAEQYVTYRDYMSHMTTVLGIEVFNIDYEGLVADQLSVSKKLIEYCGLDWAEECAAFEESDRYVKTASREQVNKPIYTSSIGRWRKYEKHIQALIDIISGSNKSAAAQRE